MATKLRRVTISLPTELDDVLARMSKLTGMPQSKFIVKCLEENISTMNTICEAVESAQMGDEEKSVNLLHQALGRVIATSGSVFSESEK